VASRLTAPVVSVIQTRRDSVWRARSYHDAQWFEPRAVPVRRAPHRFRWLVKARQTFGLKSPVNRSVNPWRVTKGASSLSRGFNMECDQATSWLYFQLRVSATWCPKVVENTAAGSGCRPDSHTQWPPLAVPLDDIYARVQLLQFVGMNFG